MFRSLAAVVLMFPVMSACATTPEPCTAEWFDWQTERILGEFVYDHRKEINDLREQAPRMFGPEGGLEQIAPTSFLVLTAIGAPSTLATPWLCKEICWIGNPPANRGAKGNWAWAVNPFTCTGTVN